MIRTYNTIQFCSAHELIKFGFSRQKAYKTIKKMKADYEVKYFHPGNKMIEIPMEYAAKWLSENLGITQAIYC